MGILASLCSCYRQPTQNWCLGPLRGSKCYEVLSSVKGQSLGKIATKLGDARRISSDFALTGMSPRAIPRPQTHGAPVPASAVLPVPKGTTLRDATATNSGRNYHQLGKVPQTPAVCRVRVSVVGRGEAAPGLQSIRKESARRPKKSGIQCISTSDTITSGHADCAGLGHKRPCAETIAFR